MVVDLREVQRSLFLAINSVVGHGEPVANRTLSPPRLRCCQHVDRLVFVSLHPKQAKRNQSINVVLSTSDPVLLACRNFHAIRL